MNEELGILYSFTSEAGSGYCVKRTGNNYHDDIPIWHYLDNDFRSNVEFLQTKRVLTDKAKSERDFPHNMNKYLNIKREMVKDQAILAKFALLEGKLSVKTQVLIMLDDLREKINEQDCDYDKIKSVLQGLL